MIEVTEENKYYNGSGIVIYKDEKLFLVDDINQTVGAVILDQMNENDLACILAFTPTDPIYHTCHVIRKLASPINLPEGNFASFLKEKIKERALFSGELLTDEETEKRFLHQNVACFIETLNPLPDLDNLDLNHESFYKGDLLELKPLIEKYKKICLEQLSETSSGPDSK